jgi:hypothetical protein
MPVQLVPPGQLDQHSLLVALTPMALCLASAWSAWIIGAAGRASRLLITGALVGALVLQTLFLLPWGPAAAYTGPLAGGLVRVGWAASATATVLGWWSLWRWRAAPGTTRSMRTALVLALPVVGLPALLVAAAADTPTIPGRRAFLLGALALLLTVVVAVVPMPGPRAVVVALSLTIGAVLIPGPWRAPLGWSAAAWLVPW